MPRPAVPPELTRRPFTVSEARRFGLTRYHLRSSSWRRLLRDVYAWAGLQDELRLRALAAARVLPAGAVVSGTSAAWLHGVDVRETQRLDLEVTIPRNGHMRTRPGLLVRRAALEAADVDVVQGLPVTSRVRTCFDLARRPPLVEAVVAADAFLHAGLPLSELLAYAARSRGWRGVRQIDRVAGLSEPAAESPMETRLRLVLVLGGLPRPVAQLRVYDRWGVFIARVDLAYPNARLALEYDGSDHFTPQQAALDRRRRNALEDAGWSVRQFTSTDVYRHASVIVGQVERHLAARAA